MKWEWYLEPSQISVEKFSVRTDLIPKIDFYFTPLTWFKTPTLELLVMLDLLEYLGAGRANPPGDLEELPPWGVDGFEDWPVSTHLLYGMLVISRENNIFQFGIFINYYTQPLFIFFTYLHIRKSFFVSKQYFIIYLNSFLVSCHWRIQT